MHSTAIIVESMSATSSRLRRLAARLDDDVDAREQPLQRGARALGIVDEQVAGDALLDPAARRATPPSASSAAEISPRVSRSFAIRVAMNMASTGKPPLALIAGPTASGKSALALALAERADGIVINADSAQVYRDLRIVSARPAAADEARAPHRLYGYRDGADACSAADWAADAKAAIAEAHAAGRLPILAGGTGLYIRTLIDGIAPVPEIDPAVRKAVRALAVGEAHAALVARGPRGGGAAPAGRHDADGAGAGGGALDRADARRPGRRRRSAASATRSRSRR